jgi:hypothetical protein
LSLLFHRDLGSWFPSSCHPDFTLVRPVGNRPVNER